MNQNENLQEKGASVACAGIRIAGTGSCLPERVITNENLACRPELNTTVEWIKQRTGIEERHVAGVDECSSDFAVVAAARAMEMAGIAAEDIDLILAATITPDTIMPSLSCWLQNRLGCREVGALDVSATCSGFIYGLGVARNMIAVDGYKNVLLVGCEMLSKIIDWRDRETCVLFGDGAGAAVLQPCKEGSSWIGPAFLAAEGRPDFLIIPGGGSRQPASLESVERGDHFIKMKGRDVFKFAVHRCIQMIKHELKRHSIGIGDIKYFIPHQANQRILDSITDRFDIPPEKVFSNIARVGNTSSASVAIGLDELNREGLIERGDLLMLFAFGGGLTWASTVVRW